MLVFAKKHTDKNGKKRGLDHILERCNERAGIAPEHLLASIADMNRYLPDDWRMTRSRNNFRIQVIAEGANPFYLCGFARRVPDGEILHIINTLLDRYQFDSIDAEAEGLQVINRQAKREHPKILVPNLYYFRPCPESSKTPLFARQFERVQNRPGVDQYHRIHGLTKSGLDPDHYFWIRWTIDGNVEFVGYPASDYHGKNYWLIPTMEAKHAESRKKAYTTELHRHGIHPTPPPPTPVTIPRYENEFKFAIGKVDEETIGPVVDFFTQRNLSIQSTTSKTNEDIYLDDRKWHLYANGASFRLRTQKDNVRITLKKRFPAENLQEKRTYRRIEEEAVISPSERDSLLKGRPIAALPYRLLAYIVPAFDPTLENLSRVLSVTTVRTTYLLVDPRLRCLEVCFDSSTYSAADGNTTWGPDCEIELESKGVPSREFQRLAHDLAKYLNLKRSADSKYERGLKMLGLAETPRSSV